MRACWKVKMKAMHPFLPQRRFQISYTYVCMSWWIILIMHSKISLKCFKWFPGHPKYWQYVNYFMNDHNFSLLRAKTPHSERIDLKVWSRQCVIMVTVMDTDIWGLAILYAYVLNDNNANLITFLKIITYLMGEQFLHRCKKKKKQ